jgi:hypothetical protein
MLLAVSYGILLIKFHSPEFDKQFQRPQYFVVVKSRILEVRDGCHGPHCSPTTEDSGRLGARAMMQGTGELSP